MWRNTAPIRVAAGPAGGSTGRREPVIYLKQGPNQGKIASSWVPTPQQMKDWGLNR
jgi:hypothetical protein